MKIYHRPDVDYISIDFKDEVEAKSYFQSGVIVRLDKKGNVIGLDITDSTSFFSSTDQLTLQEASKLTRLSESTLRRKIKAGILRATKPNGKDYKIKRSDLLKLAS